MTVHRWIPIAAVAAALLLASCGGSSGSIADAARDAAENSSDTVQSASNDGSDGSAGAGGSIFETDEPLPAEMLSFGVDDAPPNWPTYIGLPATVDATQGYFTDMATAADRRQLTGVFFHAEDDTYATDLLAKLEADGFVAMINNQEDGTGFVNTRRSDGELSVRYEPGYTMVSISG